MRGGLSDMSLPDPERFVSEHHPPIYIAYSSQYKVGKVGKDVLVVHGARAAVIVGALAAWWQMGAWCFELISGHGIAACR